MGAGRSHRFPWYAIAAFLLALVVVQTAAELIPARACSNCPCDDVCASSASKPVARQQARSRLWSLKSHVARVDVRAQAPLTSASGFAPVERVQRPQAGRDRFSRWARAPSTSGSLSAS